MNGLALLAWRQLRRHPRQSLLAVVAIALGVGVVLAIDLTNQSARRAFEDARQSLSGEITHRLTGGPGGIDEDLYIELRVTGGLRRSMPVIEGRLATPDGVSLGLLGIDPVLLAGGAAPAAAGFSASPLNLLSIPGAVIAGREIRDRLDLTAGDSIVGVSGGERRELVVSGFIGEGEGLRGQTLSNTLIADIATAQEILGMQGRLSRIDLALDGAQAAWLADRIQTPLQLVATADRSASLEQMTRAFRTNLTALSLLALLTGAFLIYNAMTVSILQRRDLISTLRTLGVGRREIIGLLTAETLLLALAGVLAGCALGAALSHYLILLTSMTLEDLYAVDNARAVHYAAPAFIRAALLGFAASLVSVYLPALDALRIGPAIARSRSRLEGRVRAGMGRRLAGAAVIAAAGFALLPLSGRSITGGFAALFLIIMAYALLSPVLLVWLLRLFGPLLARGMGQMGSVAGRGILASLSRTQVAVTALAIAVSATIGVSVMIGSFRSSVEDWLDGFLQADVYVGPAAGGVDAGLEPGLIERLRELPAVEQLSTGLWRELWRDGALTRLYVSGIDENLFGNYQFLDRGPAPDRWREFTATDSVLVSEPYAWHNRLEAGDTIRLPTPGGTQAFRVAGVFRHYGSDRGIVTLHRDVYERHWPDDTVHSLYLYLKPDADAGAIARRLNATLLPGTGLEAVDRRRLRALSLEVFDRTFAVTDVLRLITLFIAVTGILGALTAIQLERVREFAVLRAMGVTPGGLKGLLLTESGIMGAAAGLIAVPLGLVLALILIQVINRRSFGWSMEFVVEPAWIASAVILGLGAGLLAGIYPAWRATTSPVTSLQRE